MRLKQFLIPAIHEGLRKIYRSKISFIRNKPKFSKPVEFNLRVDKDNKSDYIQYVSILPTLKVLLEHEHVLGSVLDQGNDKEGNGRLRTFKDGTTYRRNELFSLDKNSSQLVLYHDFGTVNPLGNKVSKYKVSAFYFVLGNIQAKYRSRLNNRNLVLLSPSALVQRYGYQDILLPLLDDIKTLETSRL